MELPNDQLIISGLGGKKTLKGEISIGGAKNAAVKAMAASVLFRDDLILENVPEIEDVKKMADLLTHIGAKVQKHGKNAYEIKPPEKKHTDLSKQIAEQMRASIVLTGPVLARFGQVSFPHPGGCVIGERPIDIFTNGFEKMGASVETKHHDGKSEYAIKTKGEKLNGAHIFLKNTSVTATETFMMAGVLAEGETVISNAAVEPEIEDLAEFLSSCGAEIKGAGTHTIKVTGGGKLSSGGRPYKILPDRIEAGSFLILGALCATDITIKNCNPKHLEALIYTLDEAGVPISTKKDSISISGNTRPNSDFRAVNIKTHEHPGFPTDLQAPMTVFLTQVTGESMVFETIFEGRLNYVESLVTMGARITTMDTHRIMVKGPALLHGKNLESPDLRAGLAFIIAAIVAKGDSKIHNVYNIDRGYEQVEERLAGIGINVERIRNNK